MTAPDRMVVWLREAMASAQRDAEAATPGPWHVTEYLAGSDYGFDAGIGTAPGEVDVVGHGYEGGGCERVQDARHIVRHSPAAVQRRIAADRKMLAEHTTAHTVVDEFCVEEGGPCTHTGEAECQLCGMNPCNTLVWLAEGYGWTEETT